MASEETSKTLLNASNGEAKNRSTSVDELVEKLEEQNRQVLSTFNIFGNVIISH